MTKYKIKNLVTGVVINYISCDSMTQANSMIYTIVDSFKGVYPYKISDFEIIVVDDLEENVQSNLKRKGEIMCKLIVIFIVLTFIWGCADDITAPYSIEADSEGVTVNEWDDERYIALRRAIVFVQAGDNFGSGVAISDYHILTAKHLVMENDKLLDIGDISLIFSFFVSEKIAICSFSEDCINYPHHISIIGDVDLAIITLEYGLNQYINLNKTPYFDLSPEGGDWDHVCHLCRTPPCRPLLAARHTGGGDCGDGTGPGILSCIRSGHLFQTGPSSGTFLSLRVRGCGDCHGRRQSAHKTAQRGDPR